MSTYLLCYNHRHLIKQLITSLGGGGGRGIRAGGGGGALGQFRKGQCTLTDFSPPTVCDTETKIDISICDTETKIDISICDTDTKIYISIIYLLYI